ncbi:reverse transcriptase domain-containing protein [Tanacetum coccineum]
MVYFCMSPPIHRKYKNSIAIATGCKRFKKTKRSNRKIRIPIALWPCKVEEEMTLEEVDGQMVGKVETKIIARDGTITKVPGKFKSYETEEEAERDEVDSDLESTANSKPKMAPNRRSGPSSSDDNENPDVATVIAQQLQAIITQEYDGKGGAITLTRWIEKMENVIDNSGCAENQKVRYAASSLVNKALTWWNTQCQARGRVAALAMSWNDFKALMVEEFCPSNEMEKLENEFWNHKMVGANHAAYTDRFHELAKLVPHLVTPETSRIKRYIFLVT